MKIPYKQIIELWNLKIIFYSQRKPRWIWETFLIPLYVFFLAIAFSGFGKTVVSVSIVVCVIYIIMTFILLLFLHRIEVHGFRGPFAYPLTAYLYNVFDLLLLTMITISSLMVGIYSIDVMLPLSLTFYWSVIILFIIIVITICFSPRILNKKSRNRFVDGKLEKCIPLAISIGGSAIGFAILISVILSRSVKFDILRLIITILSFSGVVLVLPYIVLGFYEAIVLAISKWPRVERLGSEFKILG